MPQTELMDRARQAEQRGDYATAALHYSAAGAHAQAASCFERNAEPLKAAEAWQMAGEPAEANRCMAEHHVAQGDMLAAAKCMEASAEAEFWAYHRAERYSLAARYYKLAGDDSRSEACQHAARLALR
ncbi:MAG: hypothetical protein ACYC1M_16015 [Armatimonadota bacterium]